MAQGKQILIGSQALRQHFENYREAKDTDYLIDGELPHDRENRIEYYDVNRNPGLRVLFDRTETIPTAQELYTLKLSHCFWDNIHWSKTMSDLFFLQKQNLKVDEQLFELLYQGWEVVHGTKRAYLKKKNEDFFKDSVKRQYVHDDIHRAVAYYDCPMFEKIKKDTSSAFISRKMFEALSFDDQLKVCREEIYVTALERFMIPNDFAYSRLTAYRGACKLLLTSMTKGWFPRFIAENWIVLNRCDDHDFVSLFQDWANGNQRVA